MACCPLFHDALFFSGPFALYVDARFTFPLARHHTDSLSSRRLSFRGNNGVTQSRVEEFAVDPTLEDLRYGLANMVGPSCNPRPGRH